MKRILIIASSSPKTNPALFMFLSALASQHEITLCSDYPEEAKLLYPHLTHVTSQTFFSIRGSLKGIAHLARRIAALRPVSSPIKAEDSKAPVGSYISPKKEAFMFLGSALSGFTEGYALKTRAKKPDLIIAMDGHALIKGRTLRYFWQAPMMYLLYEVWPNQSPNWPRRIIKWLAFLEKWAIDRVDLCISPTPSFSTLYARRYHIPRNRFVDVRICPKVPERKAEKPQDNLIRFYYCGGFTENRGLENLLKAFTSIKNAQLFLRGYGSLEWKLRSLVDELDLGEKVFFLDPLPYPQVIEAGAEFHIGIISACPVSANGRFVIGLKFFEYLACGLAIVCTNSFSLGPYLKQYEIGRGFKGCDADSMRQALQFSIDHPEQVKIWMNNARELSMRDYNQQRQAQNLQQAVNALLKTSDS